MPQDESTLVQVIARCYQATNHYLSHGWCRTMLPYHVNRPQWVNMYILPQNDSTCKGSKIHVIEKTASNLEDGCGKILQLGRQKCHHSLYQSFWQPPRLTEDNNEGIFLIPCTSNLIFSHICKKRLQHAFMMIVTEKNCEIYLLYPKSIMWYPNSQ